MSFVAYKLTLSAIVFLLCLILSMRIKGIVVVNWLSILIRYHLRAKYYIYNKNESHLRTLYLPTIDKEIATKKKPAKATVKTQISPIAHRVKNLVNLENIMGSEEIDFRYRIGKKGGLNVAFEQIKK